MRCLPRNFYSFRLQPTSTYGFRSPKWQHLQKRPVGISRVLSDVQVIQKSSPYFDIYSSLLGVSQRGLSIASHTHPDKPEWRGPKGFGAHHVNDDIPFTFWDEEAGDYRTLTAQETVSLRPFPCREPGILRLDPHRGDYTTTQPGFL